MTTTDHHPSVTIEADPEVPMIHITRDFAASPAQLMAAHTDPELFVKWVGPNDLQSRTIVWDARDGGEWRYISTVDGQDHAFRGCFHQITDSRIVQTFTWEGMPDQVALETLSFEDRGNDTTRLHSTSLCDSFEARDGWLASGMEVGVTEGYAKLDNLLNSTGDSK